VGLRGSVRYDTTLALNGTRNPRRAGLPDATAHAPLLMYRDLGLAALVLAALIVVLAHGGCGGNDIVIGSAIPPSVIPTGGQCMPNGSSCASPLDCCSQLCQAAICACLSRGATCSFNNTCCSGVCNMQAGISQNVCT
jgi:hypothetical protein